MNNGMQKLTDNSILTLVGLVITFKLVLTIFDVYKTASEIPLFNSLLMVCIVIVVVFIIKIIKLIKS